MNDTTTRPPAPEPKQQPPEVAEILTTIVKGDYQAARVMLAELERAADPLVKINIPNTDFR
ncbi:MAG: hypothetical protein HQL72_04195 [Magnetococcales bacterium]|nr:hypothetical protein [Magnetococcales bacterium]